MRFALFPVSYSRLYTVYRDYKPRVTEPNVAGPDEIPSFIHTGI